MKKSGSVFELIYGIAGAALGIVLLVTNGASVLSLLTKLIGVVMLVINIPRVIVTLPTANTKKEKAELWVYLSGAIIGAVVFFLPVAAVTVGSILAGIWFLVLPIVDIVCSRYRSEQFKTELPKIIIGVALLILGPTVLFSVLVKVIGGGILVLSIVYLAAFITRFSK